VPACETYQIRRCVDDRSVIRRRGDRDPAPAAKVEQPFVAKLPQRPQDRVRVDVEHRRKIAGGRESFAWSCLSLGDGTPYFRRDLLMQVGRLLAVHLDTEHGASHSSFTAGQRLVSVLTPRPPGPPRPDEPTDLEALEALIEEARRRARRRRRWYGACTLVAVSVGLIGYFGFSGGGNPKEAAQRPSPASAPSQREPAGSRSATGIEGSSITTLAIDPLRPDTVFAGSLHAGVFKSTDGGGSWRPLTIASEATRVDALAIAPGEPQTVYAGTGRGVFKSTNGGATWQGANGGLFGEETTEDRAHRLLEGYVYSLVVDPRDSETVYAGTWRRGLLKTTNGGASWQRLAFRVVGPVMLDPNDPETIYVGLVGAFTRGGQAESGVSRSTDGGTTWQPVGLSGTNVDALAVDPTDAKMLYAGTAEGLLKSSDGGNTWRAGGLKGSVSAVTIDPEKPTTLYAATSAGIVKSMNGAGSWKALAAGREASGYVSALAVDPRSSTTLYAGTGAGVFKSTDSGGSWELANTGMAGARVDELAAPVGGSVYALVDSQGLFERARGGWRPASAGLPTLDLSALAVDPQRPERVFVVGGGKKIYTTTNGGESWRRLQAPPISKTADISALLVDPQDANNLYAGMTEWGDYAYGGDLGYPTAVFKSTDGGATWRALETYGIVLPEISMLAIDPLDSQTLYAAARGVFKSSDGGATWESLVEDSSASSLALDPSKPTTMYAGTDGGVLKSTNGGATWRDLAAGFGAGPLAINPQAPERVYAGGDDGLFISNNGGETWRRYQGDLGKRGIEALAVDPTGHTLYVGGIRGGVVEVSLTGS
jgi:photosystem II stability/assembly factor-like uncharacterized protein